MSKNLFKLFLIFFIILVMGGVSYAGWQIWKGAIKKADLVSHTFEEYARKWLETYAKFHCKETTWKNYQGLLSYHLFPSLKDKNLNEITREDIKGIIYDMQGKALTRSTIVNTIAPLREMLNHAVDDGLLVSNPGLRIGRFLRVRNDKRADINPLTSEEVSLFLQAMPIHYPRYYSFFLCAVRTGMRLGDLLALQWGDIDFHGRFIEVRRAVVRRKVVLPKNGKIRRVDMSLQLTQTLKDLLHQRKIETLQQGWKEFPEWVFVNEEGGLLDGDNIRKRVFRRCLEKAGLRRIRIHDLRHTFGSLLIAQGKSLAYIKEQMGHHSIQVTVDIYGHLIPGANKGAVDRLDDESATKRNLYAIKPTYLPINPKPVRGFEPLTY